MKTVELFNTGKISLGRAAEVAGVSTPEFKKIIAERKIVRKVNVSHTAGLKAAALIKSKR